MTWEGGEMGRRDRMRGGGTTYWACTPSTAGKMYVEGIGMYVEVGIYAERAGDNVLSVSAPVQGGRRGGHLLTYTDLPLMKCTWKEGIFVLINDLMHPQEALQL